MKDQKKKLKSILAKGHGKIEKVGYLQFDPTLTAEQVEAMEIYALEETKPGVWNGLGTLPSVHGVQILFQFVVSADKEEA